MKNKFLSSLPIVFGVLGLLMLLGIILAICIVPIYVEVPTDNVAEAYNNNASIINNDDLPWGNIDDQVNGAYPTIRDCYLLSKIETSGITLGSTNLYYGNNPDSLTQVTTSINSFRFFTFVSSSYTGSMGVVSNPSSSQTSSRYIYINPYNASSSSVSNCNVFMSTYPQYALVSTNMVYLPSFRFSSYVNRYFSTSSTGVVKEFADYFCVLTTDEFYSYFGDVEVSGDFGNYLDFYSSTEPISDSDLFNGLGVDYEAFNNPYKNCVNMLTCQSKPFDRYGNFCTLQFSYLYNGIEYNGVPEIVVKQYTYEVQGDVVAHYPIYDFGLQVLDSNFNKGFYITNYTNDFSTYFKDMFYFYNGDEISTDVANTYYNNGYTDGYDDGYVDGLEDNLRSNFYGNYAFELTSISHDGSPEFSSILNTVYLNTNVLPDFTGIQFNLSTLGINYINFVDFVLPSEHVLANYPKGINVQYDINGILSHNPIVYKLCLDNTVLYSYTSNYDSSTDKFIVDESSKTWNTTVLNQAFTNIGAGIYSRNAGVNADNELLYIDSSQLNEVTISNKFLNFNSWGYWIANASMYDINYIKLLGYKEAVADYQKNVDQAVNEAVETTRDVAYWNGFNKAKKQYSENDYTFLGLMSAIVEAPVTMILGKYDSTSGSRVGGLFNFELLGVNLSGFYLSILTLGVVIFIIKFALGRTSKDE